MRTIIILTLILIPFVQCSKDSYVYEGNSYRWFSIEQAMKNKERTVALDLSDQHLSSIPEEVSELGKLKYLNLKENNLTELPEFIYMNENLTTLLLYQNSNLKLSPSVKNLIGLEILEILQCQMIDLPEEIYELKNLKRFAIGGNKFSEEQIDLLKSKLPNCKIYESVD